MALTRLAFALKNLEVDDWRAFEEFATAFLAEEFVDLRVLSGTNDLGRDAVLFGSDDDVVVQFSIAANWRAKIQATVRRLKDKKIRCRVLIYASNQDIGPRADDIRAELRRKRIELDVRDRSYWVARRERSAATRVAAELIEGRVVDPLVPAREVVNQSPLTDPELRAGLVYLELQLRDADTSKELSHATYDSIVLGVVAGSSGLTAATVQEDAARLLPVREAGPLRSYVDGALKRLTSTGRLLIDKKTNQVRLSPSERQTLEERATEVVAERDGFRNELAEVLNRTARQLELNAPIGDSISLVDATEAALESLLERQGNDLATALANGRADVPRTDVYDVTRAVFTSRAAPLTAEWDEAGVVLGDLVVIASEAVSAYLDEPGEFGQRRLRLLADAYTLLAFVQEATDVQRSIAEIFRRGLLIVDATILLPSFVESVLPSGRRPYTSLLLAARRVGLRLVATDGVLNELNTHLDNSLLCERLGPEWQSRVPYVYRQWQDQVRDGSFADFVGRFRGASPVDDIAAFLSEELGVTRERSLPVGNSLPEAVRWQVVELWRTMKEAQRRDADPGDIELLLAHDAEMYFGALHRRAKHESLGPYSHQDWFVTTDSTAFRVMSEARRHGIEMPSDPTMHPNFLSNLLAVGPARAALEPEVRHLLPVAIELQERGIGLGRLSREAEAVRKKYENMPRYFVERKVREAMEKIKANRTVVVSDAPDWDLGLSPVRESR